MTYNDWLIKLTNTMQIRSTNYRLSQNDITLMANNVYEEIALECAIGFIRQEVIIDKTVDTYNLDALYTAVANEVPLNTMSIYDQDNNPLDKSCKEINENVFKFNKFMHEDTNEVILDFLDGQTIFFYRQVIPDIETLSARNQVLIFNAMIEGIMWYTHDAIPNPTSSNSPEGDTNMYYQRFYKAKQTIIKQLPQRM